MIFKIFIFITFNAISNLECFVLKNLYQPNNILTKITPSRLNITLPRDLSSIKSDLIFAPTKNDQVNCLGLGTTISKGLEWMFKAKDTENNPLKIEFWLKSRRNTESVSLSLTEGFNIHKVDFIVERKTVFIIHGFLSDGRQRWVKDMENAFLLTDDVNLITVDWSAHGNTWNYYKAAVNAKSVGSHIAKFLSYIMDSKKKSNSEGNIRWGPIHMVGHSLGAHICGIAANEFEKEPSPWKITRITGLDPAQPCFKSTNISLDATDGKFIDVIHTNAEILFKLGLGLPHPLGHVDFYPDGGKIQIGCSTEYESYFDYLGLPKNIIEEAICSHGRSHLYFTESLIASVANNGTFWGHPWDRSYKNALELIDELCDNHKCVEMGINADKYSKRGAFFVVTSGSVPYYDVNDNDKKKLKKYLQDQSRGRSLVL